jgi:predicted transcriptional regulator of viral defense system
VGRKTPNNPSFHIQPGVEEALAALAVGQHGVVSLDQLRSFGLPETTIRYRVEVGRLHRIHQTVYALVPRELLSRDGRFIGAVFACGPEAALSHRSAAVLHELMRSDRAKIDVTIPQRSPRCHPGIDIHRSTTLAPGDITVVNGIRVTTIARTLLDLAQVVRHRPLERACDQAEILEVLDLRALNDQIERNKSRPAARRLKGVLEEHYIGATPTWSELEERFLSLCRGAGIPQPEVNVWIDPGDDDPSAIRADFVWRDQRLVVETDGHGTHSTRQSFEHDRRRDQRLIVAGWRVIRTTWRQIAQRPDEVIAVLVGLLRR